MDDLISRQAAIEALADMHCKSDEDGYVWIIRSDAWARIDALPSAQPEQNNDSEFWRKRAEFYSDMCMNLIGEMGKGVKVKSVKISENGIEFIKEQPSAQPEIIRCRNCKFASGDSRICMKFGHSPFGELDFCAWAEW